MWDRDFCLLLGLHVCYTLINIFPYKFLLIKSPTKQMLYKPAWTYFFVDRSTGPTLKLFDRYFTVNQFLSLDGGAEIAEFLCRKSCRLVYDRKDGVTGIFKSYILSEGYSKCYWLGFRQHFNCWTIHMLPSIHSQ